MPKTAAKAQPVVETNPVSDLDHALWGYWNAPDKVARAEAIGRMLRASWAAAPLLRAERQQVVLDLYEAGMTYAEIGEAIGVSRSRAQSIAVGASGGDYYRRRDAS